MTSLVSLAPLVRAPMAFRLRELGQRSIQEHELGLTHPMNSTWRTAVTRNPAR